VGGVSLLLRSDLDSTTAGLAPLAHIQRAFREASLQQLAQVEMVLAEFSAVIPGGDA
jgi:hypothetical protein